MQRYEKVAAIVTIGGDWVSWMRQLRRFMQHNPRAVAHPCFPPPPRPLSTNQSIHRHKILLFSHDIFFFRIAKKKKRKKKPAAHVVVANRVGAWGKKHRYRLHKWPVCMWQGQTKYRIWAAVEKQAFPVFVMCILLKEDGNWWISGIWAEKWSVPRLCSADAVMWWWWGFFVSILLLKFLIDKITKRFIKEDGMHFFKKAGKWYFLSGKKISASSLSPQQLHLYDGFMAFTCGSYSCTCVPH